MFLHISQRFLRDTEKRQTSVGAHVPGNIARNELNFYTLLFGKFGAEATDTLNQAKDVEGR